MKYIRAIGRDLSKRLKESPINNKSILISWLSSYISVLLIPIIISGFVYKESTRIVEREINNNNLVMLKQIQRIVDKKMSDVKQLSLQIAWAPMIESLVYYREPMDSHGRFIISKVRNDLFLYRVANSYIDEIYIYLHKTNMFVNSRTSYSMDLLEKPLADYEKISAQQFKEFSQQEYMHRFTVMEINQRKNGEEAIIAYMQSLPFGLHNKSQATMLILLDYNAFMDEISSLDGLQQGTLLILDEKNQVIASTNSADKGLKIEYEEFREDRLSYKEINRQEYVMSSISSQINDWKYIFVLQSAIFMEKLEYIQKLIIFSIILCLVIGGIVAYLFTRRNYNPVQEIVHALANSAGIKLNPGFNEYNFIQEAIDNTLNEKQKMEKKLGRQKLALRSDFLARLIKGIPDSIVPIDEALSTYNIVWVGNNFCVMLFYIEDFSKLFIGEEHDSLGGLKLVQFIITNVTEELVGRDHKGYVTEVDDMLACLINISDDQFDLGERKIKGEIIGIARKIQDFIRKKFSIYMTISIGNIHKTVAGISQSYQETKEAMEYRMVMGSERIIGYDEIVNPQNRYDYPLEMEQQLINLIKMGNFQSAQDIISGVFQSHFSDKMISIEMTKCLFFDLMSTIIKALKDIDMTDSNDFLDRLNPITRLSKSETVMEMKYEMMYILKKVCKYTECNKKDRNQEITEQIISIIDGNYIDQNISIASIADEFGLTGPYISKIFRDQMGEGIQDYINKIRIKRAKALLTEGQLNLDGIANKVGYCNSNGLIRIFKKYEGLTPGQYRNMNR